MAQTLPVELTISLLESAYYDGSYSPDHATLRACSLVCRAWNNPAQTLLFRSLTLRTPVVFGRLKDSLVNNPLLGLCVRILHLNIGNDAVDPAELLHILPLVPRLYELSLVSIGIIELSSEIVGGLQEVAHRPSPVIIRSLVLSLTSVQSRILYQILDIWPTIRFLRIESELAASPPPQRPPFRLYELIVKRIPSAQNISWLLSGNDNALRFLEIRDDPSTELELALGHQAKYIRSLRLARYNIRSTSLLNQCSNLEELFLWSLPTVVLMPSIPNTIKHFAFHDLRFMPHSTPYTLGHYMNALVALPNLHTITCRSDGIETLQSEFLAKGVSINFRPMLPYYVFEDPVVVDKLPRGKSVANFSLMNCQSQASV